MSKDDKAGAAAAQLLIDDEPDDWCVGPVPQDRKRGANRLRRDKRIFSTGCAGNAANQNL
jgi:cytochrome c oxidase assembly factor 4